MPVTKYSQDPADCPGMTGEGDICTIVVTEHIIKQQFHACIQSRIGLPNIGFPEWIVFGEPGLEVVGGELFVDPGLTTSSVAGVDPNGFTKQLELLKKFLHEVQGFTVAYLFHDRDKWLPA